MFIIKKEKLKYHYDVQGNLLEEQGSYWKKQYTYDAANHQRSVAIENQTPDKGREHLFQQNQYDAEDLRYEVEENGRIHYFLFDRGELAEESQEDSSIRYLRGYQPIALERSKEKEYFVQDEAGSTLFLLDKDHEIQKTYRYDAFGIILKETGSDGELSNRLTYTGQMFDGATGQYYLRARFYHPEIGRFMQEDMYRGDGLNLYAYCANNPVMYYDPSGYGKKNNIKLCLNVKTEPGSSSEENFNLVKPEAAVTGSKKHGINWKDGPARAKATGNPQGQWAKSDLDYATKMANTLKPGESAYFNLPEGSKSIVHMPDGSTQPATQMWIRNNGTSTWHGYPMR